MDRRNGGGIPYLTFFVGLFLDDNRVISLLCGYSDTIAGGGMHLC